MAGCRLSWRERPDPTDTAEAPVREEAPKEKAPPRTAAAKPSQSELEKAIADLEATGKLDAAGREKLLADLRQTDPSLWPEYLTVFRSVLEYQNRSKSTAANPASVSPASATSRSTPAEPVTPSAGSTEPGTSGEANQPATAGQRSAAADLPPSPTAAAPPESAAPIQQVAHRAAVADPSGWRGELDRAIGDLERQLTAQPDAELASRLGLLRIAADRRDEALRGTTGLSPDVQAYWSSQLYALSTFLDARRSTSPAGSEAEAVQHLRLAVAELAETAPLVVRNPHFCTEVSSYGVFKPFENYRFAPSQEVLLYAEIENFKSQPVEGGHHTALAATYRILDAQGREAIRGDLGRTEETCRNVRRDYFVRYFLALPEHLYDGKYTLQLTIEDLSAKKVAQATIELVVERAAKN